MRNDILDDIHIITDARATTENVTKKEKCVALLFLESKPKNNNNFKTIIICLRRKTNANV